ncbi:acyl-CoA N-acyltransferase [Globomyces pollinis-pini]|nr:acyl-CoA N-acyltransferase [Globomyces pollinis-pini]
MNIQLRALLSSDVNQIQYICNNQKVTQFLGDNYPFPFTIKDAKQLLVNMVNSKNVRGIIVDDVLAGCIGVKEHEGNLAHILELGFYLGEDYWGKGIMARIIPMFLNEHVTVHFPTIHRITARALTNNVGSCKVLEKSGFTLEGVLKDGFYRDQVFYDDSIYGLIVKSINK